MTYYYRQGTTSHSTYTGLKNWFAYHGHTKFGMSGDNLMVCCPFHGERNPSCGVIVDSKGQGLYQCFSCGERGSIRKLIKYYEGANSNTTGLLDVMKIGTPVKDITDKKDIYQHFVEYDCLPEGWLNRFAYKTPYWKMRGLNEDTVKLFKLGFDPSQFAAVIPVRHYETEDLIGACFRFWDTHPQFPEDLKTRILNKEIKKYRYSPGTKKTLSFAGLETWKLCNYDNKEVYLFEGCIDALNFWQRENKTSFAKWGTDLNFNQVQFLKKNFAKVNIVIDNDQNNVGFKSGKKIAVTLLKERVNCDILKIDENVKDYSEAVEKNLKDIKLIRI